MDINWDNQEEVNAYHRGWTKARKAVDPVFKEKMREKARLEAAKRRANPKTWAKEQAAKKAAKAKKPEVYKEASRRHVLKDTKLIRFKRTAARAGKLGIPCNLVFSEIVWPEHCPVLGIKLDYDLLTGENRKRDNRPSFDRIDPTKGYVKGNVLIVSNRANTLKNNATPEELMKVAQFYNQATPVLLESQKRATSNVIPGAVLANLLAKEPGFVEDVQGPDDDFGGISRDTIEFSHD